MKRFGWLALIPLVFSAQVALADFSDFDFTAQPKCQDKNTSTKGDTVQRDEHWAYDVVANNKSARDYTDVEIRYIIFRKEAITGAKSGASKIVRKEGVSKVPEIKAHATYNFTTDVVELKKTQLAAGWTYANGASPRSFDSFEGIWIRVFAGAKQVGEFSAPQGLKTKEKWDAPAK